MGLIKNNLKPVYFILLLKDRIPKELTSGAIYKFKCGLCIESYYDECVRHLNVRIGDHIRISPLTKKKVKPKSSAISDHLLLCNHSPSFENFSVLTKENKKFLLELKERNGEFNSWILLRF